MKTILQVLCLSFIFIGCSSQTFIKAKKWSFEDRNIQGWNLQIDKKILKNKALYARLEKWLEQDLNIVNKVIPLELLKGLKKTKIWISNESHFPMRKGETGTIVFHPDAKWLQDHLLPSEFVASIHIINPKELLDDHKILKFQASYLLHELTHSFYYHCLGGETSRISDAYKRALKSKRYDSVQSSFSKKKIKSYAIQNELEYFAELSESYLYKNDYFPFSKEELKSFDPIGFEAVSDAWSKSCSPEKF